MNDKEIRYIDPNTGAEKGVKLARFDLIPQKALYELARHYGVGAQKYAEHNFRKGYPWGFSLAAAMRHLASFWEGEDLDEETGSKHVIAAAWHCLALATFMDEHKDKDNRYKPVAKNDFPSLYTQNIERDNKLKEALKKLAGPKLSKPENKTLDS